jgi:exopolysaccharide biosynthesis polyprenyl glycosylphosphotransferase
MTYGIFKIFRANGYDLHHVVVIADSYSDIFIERILNEKEWGFKIDKIFTNSKLIPRKFGKEIPIYPEIKEDIEKSLSEEVIDEVIYCKHDIDKADLKELTHLCNEIGVIFRLQSGLSPLETLNLEMETLNNENQIYLSDTPSLRLSLFFKNVSDLYFSFFVQILLIPVYLIIAAIIKIDSRGPVFFVQERVGLRGRKFMLYKFRTMIRDAEKVLDELKEKNEVDGPVFKIKKDPRITRVGGFLRKTGLDELPQFLNVLRGEMSLIGPRPPLPSEVAQYERWQLRRLSVKPGITCTWQVIPNRNEVKFEHWMKLDLQYIDNWNLQKDMKLFFQTIRTIFMAGGH